MSRALIALTRCPPMLIAVSVDGPREHVKRLMGTNDWAENEVLLIVSLMERNADEQIAIRKFLDERATQQLDEALAILWAVREQIRELFQSAYMPTENVILRAVFNPDPALIEQALASLAQERLDRDARVW